MYAGVWVEYRCFAYYDRICTTWVCGVPTTRFSAIDSIRIGTSRIMCGCDQRSTGTQSGTGLSHQPSPKTPQSTSATISLTSYATLLPCISITSHATHLYACSPMATPLHSYSFYLHAQQHRCHGTASTRSRTSPTHTHKHDFAHKVTKTPPNVTKTHAKRPKMTA